MKKVVLLSSALLATFILSGCGQEKKEEKKENAAQENIPVQVLAINDFHGAIDTTSTLHQLDGSEVKDAGLVARMATVLNDAQKDFEKQYHATKDQTIRVESGDLVGASPAASSLLQDEPVIKIMNKLHFNIGTLGNHEFDEGLPEFNRLLTNQEWDGNHPMTKEAVQNYKQGPNHMQLVVSNVETTKGKVPFQWKPYTTIEVKDKEGKSAKIGFIGVVTPELKTLTMSKNLKGYKILDPAKQIVKYSKELEKQDVKAICVLAHTAAGNNKDGSKTETEKMLDQVKKLDPKTSVDAVFAGHDHQLQNKTYQDILVTESANQGKAVMNIVGEIDPKTKDFSSTPKAKVIPVDDKVKPNQEIEKLVKEAEKEVQPIVSKKVAVTKNKNEISEECNTNAESALGDLITDGQLAMAKKEGFHPQAAITNTGGIRANLVVDKKGTITWGSAQAVQPFGNILQVVEISGENIRKAVQRSLQQPDALSLQFSGLTYTAIENGKDKKLKEIRIQNQPLNDKKTYQVVLNDFLCGGGDGYTSLAHNKIIGSLGTDTDVFIGHLQKIKEVSAPKTNRKELQK